MGILGIVEIFMELLMSIIGVVFVVFDIGVLVVLILLVVFIFDINVVLSNTSILPVLLSHITPTNRYPSKHPTHPLQP